MPWRISSVVCLLASSGCGASGTRPEDMSVAEHQAASEEHEGQAERAGPPHVRFIHGPAADNVSNFIVLDPSVTHREIAQEHAAAAQALVDREDTACGAVDDAHRGGCPFEQVSGDVTDIEGGVAILLDADPAAAALLQAQARCHNATMAMVGLDQFDACPLAVRDLSIDVTTGADGGVVVRLTASDAAGQEELRRRSHGMTSPMPAGSPVP